MRVTARLPPVRGGGNAIKRTQSFTEFAQSFTEKSKRRFVQDATVSRLARILAPGGEFRFVTDIADYAAWTLQRLLRSADFEWTAQGAEDWRKAWPGFINTRYHAKASREERLSCFLIFRRV